MAQTPPPPKQLSELIRQAEQSRQILTGAHQRLSHALDVPARIKSSISGKPSRWLGGSLVAGFATSLLMRSRKRRETERTPAPEKKRGILLGILLTLFTLTKPTLKTYAIRLLSQYLANRMAPHGRQGPRF